MEQRIFMSVTKKDVAARYGVPTSHITQYGAKQAFTVVLATGKVVLSSYLTIVAIRVGSSWFVTDYRYSVTTSRHIKLLPSARIVTQTELEALVYK